MTRPAFLAERCEDMLRGTPAHEPGHLNRYGSLRRAGVTVLPSSDTPYGRAAPGG
ncbi:hypothetical protein [Nonomuraea jabiensis]|uniref:hypothetical protein n=1 Tax=Nonomuraea jabiensis TaxID=882448 RepID=UPI003D713EAA